MPFLFAAMYPTHNFQSLDSTNNKAKELAECGAISGTAVMAEYQTQGRGRLGKEWHSTVGKGLYCSIIIRPDIEVADYPKITLVAGLSVALVLDRVTGARSQMKWPNDIYFSGKKIAGILTESSSLTLDSKARYAIVGIGVNVNHAETDLPEELRNTATSLFMETGVLHIVEPLFQAIRVELLDRLQEFSNRGFRRLLEQWRTKDFLLGKEMDCVNTDSKRVTGIGMGVDDQGRLHVRDAGGRIHEVLSGDVRLAIS